VTSQRPMKVDAIEVSALIGQSVDKPCHDNEIYVRLTSTKNLYKICEPVVTITGLIQSQ
jgi:hypothetical protein